MQLTRDEFRSIKRHPMETDFSDITTSVPTSQALVEHDVDGRVSGGTIDWDVEPTAAERVRIMARMSTINSVQESLILAAWQALDTNRAWRNRTSTPTNAQVLAQIDAHSRQLTGLIRLVLQSFDSTD